MKCMYKKYFLFAFSLTSLSCTFHTRPVMAAAAVEVVSPELCALRARIVQLYDETASKPGPVEWGPTVVVVSDCAVVNRSGGGKIDVQSSSAPGRMYKASVDKGIMDGTIRSFSHPDPEKGFIYLRGNAIRQYLGQ